MAADDLHSVLDEDVPSRASDPAELAALRDRVRLAFITMLRCLPVRQRAVLILRDVFRWRSTEVAALLQVSVVSVNSALQRARATLAAVDPDLSRPSSGAAALEADAARYVEAFERYDVGALVMLLTSSGRDRETSSARSPASTPLSKAV